jgi:hypothetical protein
MVYSNHVRKIGRLRVAIWQPLKINQLSGTLPIPVPAGVTVGYRLGNLLKAKGRGWKGRPRRAYARTLRSVIRKGSLQCPANFVPGGMRHTGMRGALNGAREEAHT